MDITASDREWLVRFAFHIRKRMEYLELTQVECAKRADLTQSEMSLIIKAKTAPSVITIKKLSVALCWKPYELLDF